MERNIIYLDTVDSTNSYLKRLAKNGAKEGTIVLAKEQTQGKGRKGRSFQSEQNMGIYMSVLWKPQCELSQLSEVTAWVAVAVARAIEGVTKVSPGIKWVNDLILNHKKVSGILTESSIDCATGKIQYLIIGIGVNVHNKESDFSEEVGKIATSLECVTGKTISKEILQKAMIAELEILYKQWPTGKREYLEGYRKRCITTGKDVIIERNGEKYEGKALEVTEDFRLKIKLKTGEEEIVSSGEVSVRGLNGYLS